jgi:hypothetical protein
MGVSSDLLPDEAVRAVASLAEAFDARSVRYALIGWLAVVLRGRLRFTQDVDFLLEVPQIVLPGLLDDLVDRGFELDPPTVIKQFIREYVTSFPFHGVRIDWLKPFPCLLASTRRCLKPRMDRGPSSSRGHRRGTDPDQDGLFPAPRPDRH